VSDVDNLERPEDIEKDGAGVVRRWLLELKLADKRESDWRKKAEKVWDKYRQKDAKKHSFNILYPNTDTLLESVYNSLPKPDVRRRFKDTDPVGKAVSEVLSRSLEYGMDTTDFEGDIQSVVLDFLLPGRGVARVRYVPTLAQVGVTEETHKEENEVHTDGGEALEGESEEVEWERAPIEHVQWDDFRILCPAKTWGEVTAIGFRHRFTREELCEKFGDEIGDQVKLDSTDDDEIQKERDETLAKSFQTCEAWEIWDKEEQEVIFVTSGYKEGPLKTLPDPLGLQGFYPIPRPIYAVNDSASLVPKPLFNYYLEQAEELDRVSTRINKLVEGLKLRGIYDATLTELSELMKGQDNDLIPAQNVTALLERGGLEKAIWFIPIQQAAQVLIVLREQRNECKQIIYELTGISDIMRAASDPSETFGAQKIKTKWGTQRLQKMQREVQRFIRDLIRLQAEVIAERFAPETLATMTGIKLPRQVEVEQQYAMQMQQWQQQVQQMQMQPPQPGQPPQQPPPQPQPPNVVTWEQVIQVMRDDKQRTFKVDIETDSTVAATADDDMQGITEVLTAVVKLIEGFGPAVQTGAMPIEAVKEMVLMVCRRAKMGNAVEDALENMKQPNPPPDPNAAQLQVEQMKAQLADQQHQRQLAADLQAEERKAQIEAQLQAHEQQVQAEQNAHQQELEAQRDVQKAQIQAEFEARKQDFERWKTEFTENTKVLIAELNAKTTLKNSAMTINAGKESEGLTEMGDDGNEQPTSALAGLVEAINNNLAGLMQVQTESHGQLMEALTRPKQIVRGPDGRAVGVQ